MVQNSIFMRKLISILFFSVLIIFLLYIFFERVLNRIEFKKRLKFVKSQLLCSILKEDFIKIWDLLVLDEFEQIELDTKIELNELKKHMFFEWSKQDLEELEQRINADTREKEKQFHRLILLKYRDAIKSLNNKVVYLKNELDSIRIIFEANKSPWQEYFLNDWKDEIFFNNLLIENKHLRGSVDFLKKEAKNQKIINKIVVTALILLCSTIILILI